MNESIKQLLSAQGLGGSTTINLSVLHVPCKCILKNSKMLHTRGVAHARAVKYRITLYKQVSMLPSRGIQWWAQENHLSFSSLCNTRRFFFYYCHVTILPPELFVYTNPLDDTLQIST